MTYRNKILVTASDRFPLVSPVCPRSASLSSQSAACLDQIRTERCVLRPELPKIVRPFAGMLGRGCKAEASAGVEEEKEEEEREVEESKTRGETLGAKARKKGERREQQSTAATGR